MANAGRLGEEFAYACAEGCEAENAVVGRDEGLEEAAGFGEGAGAGAENGEHRDLREAVGDSLLLCFGFGEANVCQLGIDEGAGWDLGVRRWNDWLRRDCRGRFLEVVRRRCG